MAEIDISDVLRRARKNCSGTSKSSTEGRAVLAHIERQAAEIERQAAEIERLRAAVPDADGARFRWLCEDHSDRETREQCRSLIDRLPGMSYSAAVMSIDAAMAAAPEPPPRNKGNAERMADAMRVADARYAYLRTITPGQLAQVQKIAREGELTFDQAVDEARAWRG